MFLNSNPDLYPPNRLEFLIVFENPVHRKLYLKNLLMVR